MAKSIDKSLKPGWQRNILKQSFFYLDWPKTLTPQSWADFEKNLLLMERLDFLTGYAQKTTKKSEDQAAMTRYKKPHFFLYRPNGLTSHLLQFIRNTYDYQNQLYYWTGHIQSIVKVKNKV